MILLLSILIGIGAALGALAMPGMMNMSVVSKCLDCGRRHTRHFILGIVTTILLQASIGIIGARFLNMNPQILETLKVWAIPVFIVLAVFFAFRGITRRKSKNKKRKSARLDGNHYLQGMALAAMNLLAVPYYYLISTYFFTPERGATLPAKLLFLVGLAAGAYLILTTYSRYAKTVDKKANLLTSNLNFIISGMLVILALTQTFRVIGN